MIGAATGGLVRTLCIKRNPAGQVSLNTAAPAATHGDGTLAVTLDQVITTMRQTGLDMSSSYNEIPQDWLAVIVPEC